MTKQLLLQVPNAHIYRLDLIPNIDQGLLKISVLGSQSALGGQCQVSFSHTAADLVMSYKMPCQQLL